MMRMRRCGAWIACGFALQAAACGAAGDAREQRPPDPPRGAAVPFTRVGEGVMGIPTPGVMVVRTPREWRALWERYSWRTPQRVPPVDFAREMVAAVARGGRSGCHNLARYVARVEETPDTLFVVLMPDEQEGATCDGYMEPVDLVRIPRREVPVRFVGQAPDVPVPPPARWLAPDSAR